MNASQRLLLALLLSVEVALTTSLAFNTGLVLACLLLLCWQRTGLKRLAWLTAVTSLPALATYWSFLLYGQGSASSNAHFALLMASRLFAFVYLGAWFTSRVTAAELLASLEQNFKLSSTFTYGLLAALNFAPRFKRAFLTIQAAAYMRGQPLHFWQPTLYFKALVQALTWSRSLAMAMNSHGFQEGAQRSVYQRYPFRWIGLCWLVLIFGIAQWPFFYPL
ncbi:energy-coupling factor transporter transmembrane component T [Leuconostocaceae bacterium ESL0958]|nr:energy-coupling factor transporter transmembrane component T [Leuconostocaceae bacterium ESL0958]